jgi:hypothetical protein
MKILYQRVSDILELYFHSSFYKNIFKVIECPKKTLSFD